MPKSSRITHAAYLAASRTILVRFPNKIEWQYHDCEEFEFKLFMAAQSKGHFISSVLNAKKHGRFV